MKNKTVLFITTSAVTAALYVALTMVSSAFGLSSGAIQVRISEALCILPCFTPAAIPGLFIGCIVANILSGCVLWDIILGSIATLIGAFGTYLLRKHRFLAVLPPILSNTIIVPPVLAFVYHVDMALPIIFLTVCAGEVISCGILGELLYIPLKKVFEKISHL